MKTLIAGDELTIRIFLQTFLPRHGECHVAVDGRGNRGSISMAAHNGWPVLPEPMQIKRRVIRARIEVFAHDAAFAGFLLLEHYPTEAPGPSVHQSHLRRGSNHLCDRHRSRPVQEVTPPYIYRTLVSFRYF